MSSTPDSTGHRGICPAPFLEQDSFPPIGGFIPGRFCAPIPQLQNVSCCLPCPMTDWTYPDGFAARSEIANWVNIVAFVASLFLLVSFAVLSTKWTHRHYLSVCTTISVLFMDLAFMIPLAGNPDQCFNEITPNDMRSSGICAASGAFLLFGGWAVIIWVFLRALSLHLQICWEVIPGNRFLYSALTLGWGIPAIGLTLTLALTGVSFRFGDVCHVNHNLALQDFWGPLLAFAALALVLQFITIGYCIHVYVKSLVDDKTTTNSSGRPPTFSGSISTASARQTYRRVKRVIQLQWRGATIVLLIIGEVAFFAVVFVSMDNSSQLSSQLLEKSAPWLTCLMLSGGDKTKCLPLVGDMVKGEGVVLAVLIVLGLSGVWCLLFFGRWSMVLGWIDLVKRKMLKKNEFVSADARRFSNDPRTYEMLSGNSNPLNINPPDRAYSAPVGMQTASMSPDPDSKEPYYGKVRAYVSPVESYSVPRPPSSGMHKDWDPRMTHARGTTAPAPAYTRGKSFGD